ncbi:MAG: lactate utilization protein [Clostridiaceae bacterium]
MDKKVERTLKSLESNNMNGYFVENEEEAIKVIGNILKPGDTVGVGGSMTLIDAGIIEFLRTENYDYLDRYAENITREELKEIYRKSFFADGYITSTNALTEDGALYNVDGNGNRVAAMIYGPDKVIVVCGINKIVKDVEEAIKRNREMAAPANAKRLDRNTPCTKVGYCMDCKSEERICSAYTLIKRQGVKGRISVIIVNKSLGY